MGSSVPEDWQCCTGQDGVVTNRSRLPAEHRVWLLRWNENDFTSRGLVAERGLKVDGRSPSRSAASANTPARPPGGYVQPESQQATVVLPKPLEPIQSERRVPGRRFQIPVPKVMRQRPGVPAIVRRLIPVECPARVDALRRRSPPRGRCAGPSARTKPLLLAFRPRSRTHTGSSPARPL